MKILVVKRDKLGDMLVTTPTLQILREAMPHAEIHLLASRYNAWVVDGDPCIDRRWTYGRVRTGRRVDLKAAWEQLKLYLDLKRQRFDVVIAAGGEESPRALARALHAGGKRTIGYAVEQKWRTRVSDPLTPDTHLHESLRIAGMLAPLGIGLPTKMPAPRFSPPAFALAYADQWLAAQRLAARGYIVLGLGSRIPQKQPGTDQILRWARWAKEKHGLHTVFIWTPGASDNPLYPGDDAVARPVVEAGVPYIHPFRGPLKEAIGIVWRAATSMFPDSGLMHFAAASPGGVLGFFADTAVWPSPMQWAPLGPCARWLEAEKSVGELADEAVFAELESLLR